MRDSFHKYIRGLENVTGKVSRKKSRYVKKGYNRTLKDYRDVGEKIHQMRKEGKTLQQIGEVMGVTRERVRQIYKVYKIRNPQLHLPVTKERRTVSCETCGKDMQRVTSAFTFYKKRECRKCYIIRTYKKSYGRISFRRHERSPYCLVCQKTFTQDFPYFVSNRCKKCAQVERIKKITGDRRRAKYLTAFYLGTLQPS